MSIDEKAGQMFISGAGINPDGSIGKKEGMVLQRAAAKGSGGCINERKTFVTF